MYWLVPVHAAIRESTKYAFGFFISETFGTSFLNGALLSVVIYRAVGVACLLVSLFIGGRHMYRKLKAWHLSRKSRKKKKMRATRRS